MAALPPAGAILPATPDAEAAARRKLGLAPDAPVVFRSLGRPPKMGETWVAEGTSVWDIDMDYPASNDHEEERCNVAFRIEAGETACPKCQRVESVGFGHCPDHGNGNPAAVADAKAVLLRLAERIGPTMEEMARTGESPVGSWGVPMELWPSIKAASGWQPAPKSPFPASYGHYLASEHSALKLRIEPLDPDCSDGLNIGREICADDEWSRSFVTFDRGTCLRLARDILRHYGEGA